jgi:hypothetical protein
VPRKIELFAAYSDIRNPKRSDMAPVRKHNITSKLSVKRPKPAKDPMELLEEGLYKLNVSRAMDLDTPRTERDIMYIDIATIGATRFVQGIPPPTRLIRSTNLDALLVLPYPLLPSAAGIV